MILNKLFRRNKKRFFNSRKSLNTATAILFPIGIGLMLNPITFLLGAALTISAFVFHKRSKYLKQEKRMKEIEKIINGAKPKLEELPVIPYRKEEKNVLDCKKKKSQEFFYNPVLEHIRQEDPNANHRVIPTMNFLM